MFRARIQVIAGLVLVGALPFGSAGAQVYLTNAALFLDFAEPQAVRLAGARHEHNGTKGWLSFDSAVQFAETNLSHQLDGVKACSVGGWFFIQRRGEQVLLGRGMPETAPGGERMFRPAKDWANFFLGTDQHGFLMGCINGNSHMSFPLVTLSDVAEGQWHQLVLVKDARGGQQFYHNGTLVHSDADAETAGQVWPFRDTAEGLPVRLAMPFGGRIGEVWVVAGELSAEEIRRDFESKRTRYGPALPATRLLLREIDARPAANLWRAPISAGKWPQERERIRSGVLKLLGPFPTNTVPLDPHTVSETDCG